MNSWQKILQVLSTEVDNKSFETWLKPIEYAGHRGDAVQLRVPDRYFRSVVEENFGQKILDAIRRTTHFTDLVLLVQDSIEKADPAVIAKTVSSAQETGLNARYTFDTFVVGASNQFAHAASMAVSKTPGHSYNPLFIYGGVGLGKTHLLNAIGNEVQRMDPKLRITLLPSERFMNEVINSVQKDRLQEFRKKYRQIDVLLIDDIQFIAGKERTSQEFFFTFNHLYEQQKQIVISSDSSPKDIKEIEERLHSRFEWGLVVDIRPPDLETKAAILKRKAAIECVDLPDDIALFVASKIKSNVRELEGALTRLAAYASLKNSEITMALTKEALKDLLNLEERVITIDLIQKVVSEEYGLKVTDLRSRNNARRVSFPRQVAMYLAKELTDSSLPDIGKSFNGKHHSTVIHSIGKITTLRKSDPDFNRQINNIIERFR